MFNNLKTKLANNQITPTAAIQACAFRLDCPGGDSELEMDFTSNLVEAREIKDLIQYQFSEPGMLGLSVQDQHHWIDFSRQHKDDDTLYYYSHNGIAKVTKQFALSIINLTQKAVAA